MGRAAARPSRGFGLADRLCRAGDDWSITYRTRTEASRLADVSV